MVDRPVSIAVGNPAGILPMAFSMEPADGSTTVVRLTRGAVMSERRSSMR